MKISAIINQITFLKGVYYSIWFQENKPAFVFIVLPTISPKFKRIMQQE